MRTRGVFTGTASVILFLAFASVTACIGDDPVKPVDAIDASSEASASGDGSTSGNDAQTSDDTDAPSDAPGDAPSDAGADADADAGPTNFCNSAEAAGAAFCNDFQSGANVADGWDSVAANGGATITGNQAFGFNSTKSATIKLANTNGAQGTLSKTVSAGALKAKVSIQYDAYFVFPSWPANSYNGFVTGITRTQSAGVSSQYYFDLERQPADWKITAQTGTPAAISTPPTANAWHRIDMTYDASGAGAQVRITIDGTLVGAQSLVKGAGNAPASFDEVTLNAGMENYGSPVTTTELTIDNVVVRFP